MTLCITCKLNTPEDGISRAICYSDSLITTTGPRTEVDGTGQSLVNETGVVNLLRSDEEVKHRTTRGIKLQIVKTFTDGGQNDRSLIFSIAGAVPLGLQSLIHLNSVFETFYETCSFDECIAIIRGTLTEFWQHARDRNIEYLITATDDDGEAKVLYVKGADADSELYFEEIQEENGLLLSVIGDRAEDARSKILSEAQCFYMGNVDMYSALEIACIRMMRRAIVDLDQQYVGGNMQACLLKGKEAYYVSLDDGQHLFYRGIQYSRRFDEYPRRLNTNISRPSGFLVMPINNRIYNPQTSIDEVLELLNQQATFSVQTE